MRIPGRDNLSIAVLGAGAVGGFVAALFLKKGFAVTCIVKESSLKVLSEKGMRLESETFGDFIVRPKIVGLLENNPDILFIATKATGLKEAIERVAPERVRNSVIVPLLNGIEHMQLLRSVYGKRVVAASIGSVELKRISPGHILHSTPSARIELASEHGIPRNKLMEIAELISEVGIPIRIIRNEAEVLWGKLVRLNALACTTSASRQPIGFVRSDKWWRQQLEGCVKEGITVARAEGVELDFNIVMEQVDNLPPALGTSMQRDIISGRPSELDAIAGAVVRAGTRHGLNCPVIKNLIARIGSV